MDRLDLGTRLRGLRSERGLSLSRLEAGTAISSSFLSLVESGKSDITISRLVRLADFYEVELGELVEGRRVDRRPIEVIREGEGSVLDDGPVRVSRGDAVLIRDGADRVVNVGRGTGRLLVVGAAVDRARTLDLPE